MYVKTTDEVMLESKLKRRYTWPVELLGVIVEDGEVIIGTEEQIFPNGQINADFINLQQNLQLQSTNCLRSKQNGNASVANTSHCSTRATNSAKVDGESSEISRNPLNRIVDNDSGADTFEKASCSENRSLKHEVTDENESAWLLSCSRTNADSDAGASDLEQEKYTEISPRIINITGSHGKKEVDHKFCTCGKSTNKLHIDHRRASGAVSRVVECTNGNSIAKHVECKNGIRECYDGTCSNNEHSDPEDNSGNEILEVEVHVSSLYPVTEEDVFDPAFSPNTEFNSVKKPIGKLHNSRYLQDMK